MMVHATKPSSWKGKDRLISEFKDSQDYIVKLGIKTTM